MITSHNKIYNPCFKVIVNKPLGPSGTNSRNPINGRKIKKKNSTKAYPKKFMILDFIFFLKPNTAMIHKQIKFAIRFNNVTNTKSLAFQSKNTPTIGMDNINRL